MIGIYKITNLINGKVYIGQSQHIETRKREHRQNSANYPINKAISKYGIENFRFDVLEECLVSELNDKEIHYIREYKTYENGYNCTIGGDGTRGFGRKLTRDDVYDIYDLMRAGVSNLEIAEMYDLNAPYIVRINKGEVWTQDGIDYPIRTRLTETYKMNKEELLKDIAELGYTKAGEKYEMSNNGLKLRAINLGLPDSLEGIQKLYGNYNYEYIEAKDRLGNVLPVNTLTELVHYIYDNELTTTTLVSIRRSVMRAYSGVRKSYLGIVITQK